MFFHNNLIHNFWSFLILFIYIGAYTFCFLWWYRLWFSLWENKVCSNPKSWINVFISHSTISFQCDPDQTSIFWINCVELCWFWPVNDLHLMKNNKIKHFKWNVGFQLMNTRLESLQIIICLYILCAQKLVSIKQVWFE